MDENREITCDNCHRVITVDYSIQSGFCLYCGAAFTLASQPSAPSDCASAANKIKEVYSEYVREMQKLSQNKPKTLFESLMGRNSFGADDMHDRNRLRIIEAIEGLRAASKETQGENHCAEITRLFLLEKDIADKTLFWPLVACEQLTEPLYEMIPLEELTQLYIEYNRLNPKNQSLPNQLLIKKKMAEIIEQKGGQAPRFGLFSRQPK